MMEVESCFEKVVELKKGKHNDCLEVEMCGMVWLKAAWGSFSDMAACFCLEVGKMTYSTQHQLTSHNQFYHYILFIFSHLVLIHHHQPVRVVGCISVMTKSYFFKV